MEAVPTNPESVSAPPRAAARRLGQAVSNWARRSSRQACHCLWAMRLPSDRRIVAASHSLEWLILVPRSPPWLAARRLPGNCSIPHSAERFRCCRKKRWRSCCSWAGWQWRVAKKTSDPDSHGSMHVRLQTCVGLFFPGNGGKACDSSQFRE